MTIKLAAAGTASSLHSFHSGESSSTTLRPVLRVDYVDNVAGVIPPAQPVLLSPADGTVLYNTTTTLL